MTFNQVLDVIEGYNILIKIEENSAAFDISGRIEDLKNSATLKALIGDRNISRLNIYPESDFDAEITIKIEQ